VHAAGCGQHFMKRQAPGRHHFSTGACVNTEEPVQPLCTGLNAGTATVGRGCAHRVQTRSRGLSACRREEESPAIVVFRIRFFEGGHETPPGGVEAELTRKSRFWSAFSGRGEPSLSDFCHTSHRCLAVLIFLCNPDGACLAIEGLGRAQ